VRARGNAARSTRARSTRARASTHEACGPVRTVPRVSWACSGPQASRELTRAGFGLVWSWLACFGRDRLQRFRRCQRLPELQPGGRCPLGGLGKQSRPLGARQVTSSTRRQDGPIARPTRTPAEAGASRCRPVDAPDVPRRTRETTAPQRTSSRPSSAPGSAPGGAHCGHRTRDHRARRTQPLQREPSRSSSKRSSEQG
jgi:hypothetical protein